MSRGHIVTGLDIGTSTIKVLVAEKRASEWEVLSYVKMPSFGLRRGAVVNPEETAKNLQLLLDGVQKDCGQKIHSVLVNIGGSHLHVTPSDGLISVSRADHIISEEDRDRVLQATRAINIPLNEEILDVFPKEFIIDEERGIKQPIGLTGVRLEAKVILLCYFQSYFINLTQAVLGAKLQIDDIVPSPLAAAEAVLTREQKEIGAAVIDIGSATTSLAVFEEGDLIHLAIFPLGSANITNDIAIGLRTDVSIAEDIKKQHGSCILQKSGKESGATKKKLEVSDGAHSLSFTKKQLVGIIEPRVSEILDLMQKELKSIGRSELLPGGIVLTGGGAKLPKIKDLAKQQLKLPVQIGIPKGILGLEEDPALATVAGLVMGSAYFDDIHQEGVLGLSMEALKGWLPKFRRMFRVFIP
ncbi:MAG: cell division protein FtsA [Candidatus Staskawiczbacteria bacterium RIFCSPHIGHO2_02_FULL_43_16]|uniref:Cell division protein FtsA n=1 Tax=Candidatus Staskawiczbacteria bacterium RIFCSPHIGHO2_01_FULL_41_41 TaxID=1802203 RepID=A0A1G2HSL9_9BACT|nr:MAG: cell division protein FtsA [Candidatus Staskawiczbacteria bacterium RIFCSPHIGHO2_01_FULL_41_41]OGZ68055.1 MAG: cell division protein FtsA [Candidatus Staskawiczbacteria bacterium RIFCSPHIGHO2_02_FULL_43_16]OGZ74791.1 MAG: cell division protein FtsA [Candidatus Staskawiczbacteria bacterium RIFCSPLOWO2_01_FULL_43_17b]